MDDSRLQHARILLCAALKTGDSTYMRALVVEAAKELADVLEDW